jgi:catechol 2,3-dioxygenase-like lactoylglutathione lyase family enzyme
MADGSAGVKTGGVHHARITVSDPARSREFYTGLLGFEPMMDFPDGFIVTNGTLFLGLRTGPDPAKATAGGRFDPNNIGLDHLSLSVGSKADLETAQAQARASGVPCGEIVDFGPQFGFYVLMLEDPDGIQIELVANHA